MLLEFSVIPLGRGRSISADVADLVKIIDASGLDYRLTAAGTILEGSWEQLMDVARKCHAEMRKKTERVVTFMKVDDYAERRRARVHYDFIRDAERFERARCLFRANRCARGGNFSFEARK